MNKKQKEKKVKTTNTIIPLERSRADKVWEEHLKFNQQQIEEAMCARDNVFREKTRWERVKWYLGIL